MLSGANRRRTERSAEDAHAGRPTRARDTSRAPGGQLFEPYVATLSGHTGELKRVVRPAAMALATRYCSSRGCPSIGTVSGNAYGARRARRSLIRSLVPPAPAKLHQELHAFIRALVPAD